MRDDDVTTYAWREKPRATLTPPPIVEQPQRKPRRVRIVHTPPVRVVGRWRTRKQVDMRRLDKLAHARPDVLDTGTLGAVVRAGAVEGA